MVSFRSIAKQHNPEKKRDRVQLYLSTDEAAKLAQAVVATLDSPHGVKLDVYIDKRLNTKTNREFDSAYCFIKATQESSRGNYSRQNTSQAAPEKSDTNAVIEKLKQDTLNAQNQS
jgi:hypothetical protein